MRKLNKIWMGAAVLLLSSVAFQSCSDDDNKLPKNTLGASFIQSITAGTDHVDLQWTITPTENVDGYKVEIFEYADNGSNSLASQLGTSVTSATFDYKTYNNTFTGLKPDTKYVIASQCIPAPGSSFTAADVAYFLFWTAPVFTPTSATAVVTVEKDDEGETFNRAVITVNWTEPLSIQQVQNLSIDVNYLNSSNRKTKLTTATTDNFTQNLVTSAKITVDNVVPGTEYTLTISTVPSNYSWFTTAKVSTSEISLVMPEVK